MKQHRCWFTLGLWVVLVGSVLIAGRGVERSHRPLPSRSMSAQSAALSAGQRQAVQAALRQMPLYFVENRGQMDKRVAYYVQGRDTTVYFTSEGVTFALAQEASASPSSERLGDRAGTVGRVRSEKWGSKEGARRERWVVKKEFVGARSPARLRGEGMTEAVVSYFKGPRWQWHTGLRTYSRVVYEEVWEGIDLIYSGDGGRLKYTFVVKPGADVGQIRLRYRGVEGVSVNRDGELEVATPGGGFREAKPFSYQEKGGERVEVESGYVVEEAGKAGEAVCGFRVGAYDRHRPLVIDPVVLLYCGYIGGAGFNWGHGIAVDGAGNAYVTGFTMSGQTTFPVTVGPDLDFNGIIDAFVAKVRADGSGLVYCGYIGGGNEDVGYGIAVDGAGNAYVTGITLSGQTTFPVTVGPDLTHNENGDTFVAKVRADGMGLAYCGYIGGGNEDVGYGIAVDGAGNAYVTGNTLSNENTFPETVGPDLTFNGDDDAFVAKVRADGSGLVYCGYIGGAGFDKGHGIAVDGAGNAYVMGYTSSHETTFPETVGPDLTFNGGFSDTFVAKVRADGRGLVYCGYIGGADLDEGYGIAVDGAGNAYVTGSTVSNENTFPETVGPDLTFNGGFRDAFVAKVRADGSGLVYCGYIGGAGEDRGYGIAVDGAGNACVTGETSSNQTTFPVTDGPDLTFNGLRDAFVAKVRADGRGLVYCGYIGGAGSDQGHGIAVDGAGNAYVTGEVRSGEATFPVTVGPDLTFNDRDDGEFNDAFVAKVSGGVTCADDVTGRVRITRGDFRYKRRIQRYVQTVTLTNISGSDIPGPVSLVLDNLSSNAELFQPDGHTSCTSPADSPYKNVNVGGDNALKPGKRAKVTLEFINPSHRGITYTARVLAGAGER